MAHEQATAQGKTRKYYRVTEDGQEALAVLLPKVHELVNEVLLDKEAT